MFFKLFLLFPQQKQMNLLLLREKQMQFGKHLLFSTKINIDIQSNILLRLPVHSTLFEDIHMTCGLCRLYEILTLQSGSSMEETDLI
jgi:hypothetical protein